MFEFFKKRKAIKEQKKMIEKMIGLYASIIKLQISVCNSDKEKYVIFSKSSFFLGYISGFSLQFFETYFPEMLPEEKHKFLLVFYLTALEKSAVETYVFCKQQLATEQENSFFLAENEGARDVLHFARHGVQPTGLMSAFHGVEENRHDKELRVVEKMAKNIDNLIGVLHKNEKEYKKTINSSFIHGYLKGVFTGHLESLPFELRSELSEKLKNIFLCTLYEIVLKVSWSDAQKQAQSKHAGAFEQESFRFGLHCGRIEWLCHLNNESSPKLLVSFCRKSSV